MEELRIKNNQESRVERLTDARMKILGRKWGTGDISFNHQVLCQLALPYRDPSPLPYFERESGSAYIRVHGGEVPDGFGEYKTVGVPYGTKARLILVLLATEAIRNKSPEIRIDSSFRRFCHSAGVTMSGRNAKMMKEQLLRLSACSMRLSLEQQTKTTVFQGFVFSEFSMQIPVDPRQEFLWNTEVKFSHEFYESLRTNAVPFERDALVSLKHSCRAMDIYLCLGELGNRRFGGRR